MSNNKIAKYVAGVTVTAGLAAALPPLAIYLAPAIIPLMTGVLSEKYAGELGKGALDTVTGIFGNLAASYLWDAPKAFGEKDENHDLLRLLAKSYALAIENLLAEIQSRTEYQNYQVQAQLTLPEIKEFIETILKAKNWDELERLFPTKEYVERQQTVGEQPEKVPFYLRAFGYSPKAKVPIKPELAAKVSSEDFILSVAEDDKTTKELLTFEVELSLRRWFCEIHPSIELPASLTPFVFERIAALIPQYIGELVKTEGFEKSWIAFQRSHLQAVLKEVKKPHNGLSDAERELLSTLAKNLENLTNHDSDYPQQLADSTSEILLRFNQSEENIKTCIIEESGKLQDILQGMEQRLGDKVDQTKDEVIKAKDEIIDEVRKISHETVLPNSIPSSQNFVGRVEYLDKLREAYKKGVRCFALYGIGGVGKTELAKRFAQEIGESYKAQVSVDMYGLTKALSAQAAILEIIWQFERAAYEGKTHTDANDGKPAIDSRYREFANNPQTLILLDNAENTDSVKDLTGVQACLIITSRRNIQIGEEPFQILKMSEPDAVNLLCDKGGKSRIGDFAASLAKACDYLPLALIVVKSLLLKQRLLRIDAFIEDFKKAKLDHLDAVVASFNLSYARISEELQKRWRQLAVFPADFDANAAVAVWEVDLEIAERMLEELESYSLIEFFDANEDAETSGEISLRIRLHDLARDFTAKRLSDDERFQTQFQFAHHYASILIRAEEMQSNNNPSYYSEVLKLIDTEWSNITVGQKWTEEYFEKDDDIAAICLLYANYAIDFIILRLHSRQNIQWLEFALKAARQLNNYKGERDCLGNLGSAYARLSEYRKAIDYYEQALAKSCEIDDRKGESTSFGNLGMSYISLSEYRKAINYLEKSLVISREISDKQGEGLALINLGYSYNYLGEYRKAIDYSEKSLAIFCEIGDLKNEGSSLSNLAVSYNSLGEYRKAIDFSGESLVISREIGDKYGEGVGLLNLGNSCLSLSEYQKAIEYLEKSLVISREVGDKNNEGLNLNNIGSAFEKLGEYRKAIDCEEKSLAIFREIDNRNGEGISLTGLGNSYGSLKEYRKAIEYYEQSLIISREIDDRNGEGLSLTNMGNAYYLLGEGKKSYSLLEEALLIFKAIESPNATLVRSKINKITLINLAFCFILLAIFVVFTYFIVQFIRWLFF